MGHFRKLGPVDAAAMAAHLCRLPDSDRRLRFHGTVNPAWIESRYAGLDWSRTVAVGLFDAGILRGFVELAFDTPLPTPETRAELAISIEPAFQRVGLGRELTARAVMIARNRGANRLTMLCLPENLPMRRIAKRLMGVMHQEDGTVEADLDLTAATPLSYWLEAVQDTADAMSGSLEYWPRVLRPVPQIAEQGA